MITKTLKQMKVGQECFIFSPSDYNSLHATRAVIRRKEPELNWEIKLGKGKVIVKRTS